jgi:hypothetical protein
MLNQKLILHRATTGFALQQALGGLPSPAMMLDCARTGLLSGFLHNFRRFS